MIWEQTTLNCRGILLDLEQPIVMGILNLTPDSFHDGSRFDDAEKVLKHVELMVRQGATIIDLGAMSSRPGAEIVSPSIEGDRLFPYLNLIRQEFPDLLLSIDTVHSGVARQALELGAHIINDISAGTIDPKIWQVAQEARAPYILMHMKGKPQNMQDNPSYEDVVIEVLDFLIEKCGELTELGMIDIILDPGFGFGKSVADNFRLLSNLHTLKILEKPLMVGLSRKSMVTKTLGIRSDEALNGTTALHMIALQQGAKILRVHDVLEAMQCIEIWNAMQDSASA
jgi:dihydropteroate synthase